MLFRSRWPGRNSHEILPGLFLNWVIAGAAFAIRQLPGMAMFNPMMLSMAIGMAFHDIVGTAAWAEQRVTFSLRRLLGIVILPFGLYGAFFVKGASCQSGCIPFFCSTRAASILPSRPHISIAVAAQRRSRTAVCTENLIHVDEVTESPKLVE